MTNLVQRDLTARIQNPIQLNRLKTLSLHPEFYLLLWKHNRIWACYKYRSFLIAVPKLKYSDIKNALIFATMMINFEI